MSFVSFSQLGSMGELGNQMFQIAATIGYARKWGKDPVFPEWRCRFSNTNYSDIFRGDILQNLDANQIQARYSYNDLKYVDIPEYEGNLDLIGYFQSEEYFKDCKDEIRALFSPTEEIKRYVETKYADMIMEVDKVSLHVRTAKRNANDYDVHSSANLEFIEKSQEHYGDSLYVVFADNMEFAKKLLPQGKRYFFIENETNYVDLFLMTYFSSYIVSSSTFGWWGAWLSQAEDPKVVIMKNWFNDKKAKAYLNDNHIIPSRWITIDGNFSN